MIAEDRVRHYTHGNGGAWLTPAQRRRVRRKIRHAMAVQARNTGHAVLPSVQCPAEQDTERVMPAFPGGRLRWADSALAGLQRIRDQRRERVRIAPAVQVMKY